MIQLGQPETSPSAPEEVLPSGTPVAYEALAFPAISYSSNQLTTVQVFHSYEDMKYVLDREAHHNYWSESQQQEAQRLMEIYNEAFFENGTVLMLTVPLCFNYDSCEVESVELLSDGMLRVQLHMVVQAKMIGYETDERLRKHFIIALDQATPAEVKVLFTNRMEHYLIPGLSLELYRDMFQKDIPVYNETFLEWLFEPIWEDNQKYMYYS